MKLMLLFLTMSSLTLTGQVDTTLNIICEFPGGFQKVQEILSKHLVYPLSASKDKIVGKCYIKYVVDTLGNPTNIEVQKSLRPDCDSGAMLAVSHLTGWKPALLKGRKVPIKMTQPINFTGPKE